MSIKTYNDYFAEGKSSFTVVATENGKVVDTNPTEKKEIRDMIAFMKKAHPRATVTVQDSKGKTVKIKESISVHEDAPPGWENAVEKMKKHKDIDHPFALAWYMKNKGNKPKKT